MRERIHRESGDAVQSAGNSELWTNGRANRRSPIYGKPSSAPQKSALISNLGRANSEPGLPKKNKQAPRSLD
jgi:hypothetical protein